MDTGKGYFEQYDSMSDLIRENPDKFNTIEEYCEQAVEFTKELNRGIFKVGEIIELKGSRFRIKSVKPTELRLKLLKNSSNNA